MPDALVSGLAAPQAPQPPIDPNIRSFLGGYAGGSGMQPAAPAPAPQAAPQQGSGGGIRQAVAKEWLDAGYPAPAVDGIMRRVDAESGFNPRQIGDDGTSFGLYQHHGERAARLAQWSQAHGLNPADPVTQTRYAIWEMAGGDPKAAQARPALMNAKDSRQGYGIFTAGFERPAGAPGSEETNLYSQAHGDWNGPAKAMLEQWHADLDRRGKQYDAALADAHDLQSAQRAMMLKWVQESDRPPQNAHQAWSQFSGLAGFLVLFAGAFARRSMTASLGAAGAMLQAANQADVRTYDRQYQQWKDHLDNGLKIIELLHGEARDIVDDARKSYDQKVTELQTLSAENSLERRLDPDSVENLGKNLELMKLQRDLLTAQNTETEQRNYVATKEADYQKEHPGPVPADVHLMFTGQAKGAAAGKMSLTAPLDRDTLGQMADQYLAGDKTVLSGLGYGNVGAANRAALRQMIEEHAKARGMGGADIATALAEYQGLTAGERVLGARTATMGMAVDEARRVIPQVLQTSAKVARSDYPSLNRVLLAYERGTGDPDVVRFGVALNAFINVYARAISPTGQPTVSDKEHARDILDMAWSQGQIQAGMDQVVQELQAAAQAPGDVRQEFRQGGLSQPGASASQAPSIGTVEQGYRFKGGDPGNSANWEKQ